jgi:hypothetical protein
MNLADALLHPSEYDGETIIQPWLPIIGSDFSVLHVTVFGNLFLIDGPGRIWLLDSWAGELHGVSESYEEFRAQVGTDMAFSILGF